MIEERVRPDGQYVRVVRRGAPPGVLRGKLTTVDRRDDYLIAAIPTQDCRAALPLSKSALKLSKTL